MNIKRMLVHLITPSWQVRRAFPAPSMRAIESAIRASEINHNGQIRFAVEAALDTGALLRSTNARERALEVFSELRVWDTENNNGVLIYLLLADHDVEIVADRGIHGRVGATGWEQICRAMENHLRVGNFEEGALTGIHAVGTHLVRHYPGGKRDNELSDDPVVL